MTNVGVGGSAPTISTASGGSPISSCASRSAVAVRSASSGSRRPPGNEISPAWRLRSSRRLVKTSVQLAGGVEVERRQHRGLGAAVDVDRQRGLGREQRAAQLLGECGPGPQTSSTRSSNRTSPSSVRWTGHLAAITRSFSTWSSERWAGIRMTSLKLVAQPRSAGV